MKKVLFTATVDSHILAFHIPYLKYFKDNGYEVHVATNGDADIPYCDFKHIVPFERSPFKINNLKAILQLKKIVNFEQFDIIHTHTPMGSVVTRLAAIQARKKYNTRVIYTAHGFHFFKGAPIQNWLIFYPVEKLLAYKTDTLITINNEDYEIAKKKFKTDVQYVPGVGIDPKKFDFIMTKVDKAKLRKSLGLKVDDFVMIYPAELSKRKRQIWLIESLKELILANPNIHLLLPGRDNLNGACQTLVDKLNLENNIHFLGFRKDIPQLLSISDLAVSAARQEGLPVNIMEAMYLGLPVVATDCRGNKDLIKDNKTGFLTTIIDGVIFNDRVLRLYRKTANRKEMGTNGKSTAQDYTLIKVLPLMENIYSGTQIKNTLSNEPIRILQIVTVMNMGGLETMLMNYYRNIDRNNVQFDFIVHRSEKGAYDDEIRSLGGKIYCFSPISFKNLWRYKNELKLFFANHPEYTVVHSHLDSLSALPLSIAKKAGIPVRIAHSHNNNFDNDYKSIIRKISKKLIKYEATDFAGCSESAIKFMFGHSVKNYKVINNAIDVNKFIHSPKKRIEVRNDLGINESSLVIGHIGRFSDQKNHEFLVDIFNETLAINSNSVMLLIGAGENKSIVKQQVKNLGLEKNVKFLGARSDISELMQAMDVFVMPSKYEGLGIVLVEAQASGLLCIASKKVIPASVKMTRYLRFLDLNDSSKNWAKQIISLADSRIGRKDMSKVIEKAGYALSDQTAILSAFYLNKTTYN